MPWIRAASTTAVAARARALARAVRRGLLVAGLLAFARGAEAQVLRTPLPLPLPKLDLPLNADAALRDPLAALSPERLEDLRLTRLRTLVRAHKDVLEADPHGAPIVKGEIVAWSPTPEALARLTAQSFTVGRRTSLEEAGELVVLVPPPRTRTRDALKTLQRLDPDGTYEFNHLFFASGVATQPAAAPPAASAVAPSVAHDARRVGLIDGGIAATHPVFADAVLHPWGCSGRVVPSAHGTAVASLLVGSAAEFHGAAPGAALYAADVYCGEATGGSADAIVAALAWMLHEQVSVINVSLVGPPNAVLERIVGRVLAHGALIVAAVGNDGPAAPPAYPASYPGVVAVTAVDASGRVLVEAGRSLHVDLAAPGADMLAAAPPATYAPVRGTSFAAPLVAGLLAADLAAPDPAAAAAARLHIEESAVAPPGKGSPARYGKGIVATTLRVPPTSKSDGRKPGARSF